ncbi:hypothetical protein Agub_g2748, partial [Astrephomene gubernaculifera]
GPAVAQVLRQLRVVDLPCYCALQQPQPHTPHQPLSPLSPLWCSWYQWAELAAGAAAAAAAAADASGTGIAGSRAVGGVAQQREGAAGAAPTAAPTTAAATTAAGTTATTTTTRHPPAAPHPPTIKSPRATAPAKPPQSLSLPAAAAAAAGATRRVAPGMAVAGHNAPVRAAAAMTHGSSQGPSLGPPPPPVLALAQLRRVDPGAAAALEGPIRRRSALLGGPNAPTLWRLDGDSEVFYALGFCPSGSHYGDGRQGKGTGVRVLFSPPNNSASGAGGGGGGGGGGGRICEELEPWTWFKRWGGEAAALHRWPNRVQVALWGPLRGRTKARQYDGFLWLRYKDWLVVVHNAMCMEALERYDNAGNDMDVNLPYADDPLSYYPATGAAGAAAAAGVAGGRKGGGVRGDRGQQRKRRWKRGRE